MKPDQLKESMRALSSVGLQPTLFEEQGFKQNTLPRAEKCLLAVILINLFHLLSHLSLQNFHQH
jgi:hypothetical protein